MEELRTYYNLTNPQKSILLTEQYYKATSVNNVVGRIHFDEPINIELLKKTLQIIIEQNDSTRIRIIEKAGEYLQYISTYDESQIKVIELEESDDENKIVKNLSQKHINIIDNSLVKFYILNLANGYTDVLAVSHHIVADAWTVSLYAEEAIRIYETIKNNKENIEKINNSYIHYIEEEKDYLQSEKLDCDKIYWDGEYKEEPVTQFLTTSANIRGRRQLFVIGKEKTNEIKRFCKENNISEQCLFMAAFSIYMAKISSTNNITIGMPILNRKNNFNKRIMGMFIETLPFYINVERNITVKEFLKYITISQFALLKHHRYPYEMLQKDIKEKFNLNKKMYSVAFSYQNAKVSNSNEIKCNVTWEFNGYCPDDLQMHISDMQDLGIFNVYYDYKMHGIEKNEINNIHNRLLNIIEQILSNCEMKVKSIEIVTDNEKNKIINDFNNTYMEYPREKSINDIINEVAEKYPNNIAIHDDNRQITYKDLNDEANKLAQVLLDNNINKGDVIGILLKSKNIDLMISALAILKIGASFIFLYNGLPTDRIEYILKDSDAKALIVDSENENKYSFISNINVNKKDICIVKDLKIKAEPEDIAYLIYTSGTTGKPKGIEIRNTNLINFIYSFNRKFYGMINQADSFLSITNISFDVSIAELFTPLFFGATLNIYKDVTTSTTEELANYIKERKITFAYFPPAMLNEIAKALKPYKEQIKIDKILVGVEPIAAETLDMFLDIKPDIQIINGYGPSETTICSTMYNFNNRKDNEEIVPIGSPLNNTQIYILNSDENILPINCVGELYISGEGVGKGYKSNDELTNEKYINFRGKRIFKTGDLGKWNKDGNIIFIGRNDNQIKFRGYRIDLGEIENNLKTCNGVENAVVIIDKQSFKEEKLIAFVVLENSEVNKNMLREFLSKTLPYYMLPSTFIQMDKFPITVNGKIDKKKLIQAAIKEKENEKIIKPQTNTEKIIYAMVKEKINTENISIDDNFFDIGIDSLQAISLTVALEKYNYSFSLQDFYNYPTIRLLSEKLDNRNTSEEAVKTNYKKTIQYEKRDNRTIDGDTFLLGVTRFFRNTFVERIIDIN